MRARKPRAPRIALALAGGGPLGAIYEIGALCALDESLHGISLTRLHHYVVVSAGSFIAAGLANGVSPRELCASFIENDASAGDVFAFSYGQRRALAKHAYQTTRAMLRSRGASLEAKFARHGISLRTDVLGGTRRRLIATPQPATRTAGAIASLRQVMDELGRAIHRAPLRAA